MIDLPITAEMLLTVLGSAAFSVLISMWLKHYLADWRYTNLLVLGIAELFAIAARLVLGAVSGGSVLGALLVGLAGATLATYGYEVVNNLLGLAGIGRRSDAAIVAQATDVVVEAMRAGPAVADAGVPTDCCDR